LTGLKQVRSGIHAMAAAHPGWLPAKHVADAHYRKLCGDLHGALTSAKAARSAGSQGPIRSPWVVEAAVVEAEVLVELGRPEEALALAEEWLGMCERDGMRYFARALACATALAEAKLGRFAAATARVGSVASEQGALGVTGLQLGRSYELCARIAVWASDEPLFEKYAAATAAQYRPGESSVLGALYERLMEEARQAGIGRVATADLARQDLMSTRLSEARVTNVMADCSDAGERAQRALGLLCDGAHATSGHLFLFTSHGLALVASNAPCESVAELTAFAEAYVRREIDERNIATEAIATGGFDVESIVSRWYDPSGVEYQAVLLGSVVEDAYTVTGVALLALASDRPRDAMMQLTIAIAKSFVASGDAVAVPAA